jgi:hypothetical protein
VSIAREEPGPVPVPAVFANLVDDSTLLQPRASAPPVAEVAKAYLTARVNEQGGITGQLLCPVSRLPELVTELARLTPDDPVDLALVVDTGLGAVPKALSLVLSREQLLTPRAVETAAPDDLDSTWLERVSEFVPEDVTAVIEPRRPLSGDEGAWLDAVRRVADHGASPKLRCGGRRPSDVPGVGQVSAFLAAADAAPVGFTASLGLRQAVVRLGAAGEVLEHGMLNMVVAVARALVHGDVEGALVETDGAVLAREAGRLSDTAGRAVRGLLARCGCDSAPQVTQELISLGLLAA